MLIFADTADLDDIRLLHALGLVDGVTTNPSLIAKSGRDFKQVIGEICATIPGPVSAEVAATDYETMMLEGRTLAAIAENVVVKIPLTLDGLRATAQFAREGINTNVTLCFGLTQGLLAAKAGATFVSPFVGRLDDINQDGMQLIEGLRQIYDNYTFDTRILAASLRSANHVAAAALAGADAATIPPAVIRRLAEHPLTDAGLRQFTADWKATGQSIL